MTDERPDERPDAQPDEGLRVGSLCSGVGALDLGVTAALGGRAVWHAEIDPDSRRVLRHRWPGLPMFGDITTTNWSRAPAVDLLAGGFPCQSVSHNGRRRGLLAAAESHGVFSTRAPWQGFTAAVAALRPRLVVIENVRGLLSARVGVGAEDEAMGGAFGRVLGDLADLGFDAEWLCAGADELAGAAHRRRRVFIVAAAADAGGEERARWAGLRPRGAAQLGRGRPDDRAVAAGRGWGEYGPAIRRWARVVGRPAPPGLVRGPDGGTVANARFTEWMMGLPEGWVCDVPGMTPAAARRLLGNGVVWQQASAAVRALLPRLCRG